MASVELKKSDLEALRLQAESDFWFFANATMDEGFYSDRVHTPLCNFMQGPSTRKLIVLPRSFLKTTIVNRYALWRATKNLNMRILLATNTMTNAEKKMQDIMGIVQGSQFYQACWPHAVPNFNKGRWSVQGACLNRSRNYPEATFEPAGVGTNLTGRHYNMVIEDDTVAPSKDNMTGGDIMPTREEIEKAVGFHKLTTSLLVSAMSDEKMFVGTRWAEDDIIYYITDAVKEGREVYNVFNMAATDDGTREGEAIYHRMPKETLKQILAEQGDYLFDSLYLNSPKRRDSNSFNPEWIKYYTPNEFPTDGNLILCVDPADPPTGKTSQDYTAFNISKFTAAGLFIQSSTRERISSGSIVTRTLDMMDEGAASRFTVEINKHAHLEEAFHDEMNRRGKWHSCSFIKHKTPKEFRVGKLSPLAQSGRLFFPAGGACKNLEYELSFFGRIAHDDEADALAMQLEEGYRPAASPVAVAAKRVGGLRPRHVFKFDNILEELQRKFKKRSHTNRAPFSGRLV